MSPRRWYQRSGAWRHFARPTLLLPSDRQIPRTLLFHWLIIAVCVPLDALRRLVGCDWKRPAPRDILFVTRHHLGDFLMSVPCLVLARKNFPEATITVVLQKRYIGQLNLTGIVDHAIPESDESLPFLVQLKFWWRRFREHRYDAVVFHRITRPDFPAILVAFLVGVPYRVGGADKGTSGLLTDLYSPVDREHVVDYHLNLVRSWLDLPSSAGTAAWPVLLDEKSAVQPHDIVIAPFAQHSKIWPLESWCELLRHLQSDGRHLRIALSATPAFAEQSRALLREFPEIKDLSETTGTLADLFATVQRTRLLIAVDTGIRHVAATVGTPCVVLGQGREHIKILGQYVDTERYLMQMVPCAPCGAEPCPLGHLQCIRGITVDEVMASIRELTPDLLADSFATEAPVI